MFEVHVPSCGAGGSHPMPLNTKPSKKIGRFYSSQNYARAKLLSRNVHQYVPPSAARNYSEPPQHPAARSRRGMCASPHHWCVMDRHLISTPAWRPLASPNVQAHDYHSRHASSDSGFLIYNWIYRFPIDSIPFYRKPLQALPEHNGKAGLLLEYSSYQQANNVRIE